MFENKDLIRNISLSVAALSVIALGVSHNYSVNTFRKWFYNVWDDISDIKRDLLTLNIKIAKLAEKDETKEEVIEKVN